MSEALDIDFSQVPALGTSFVKQLNRLREFDPVYWSENEQAWIVTGHREVLAGLRGDVPVSADRTPLLSLVYPDAEERERELGTTVKYFSKFLINYNPPEHLRLRLLMAGAFNKKTVEAYRPFARQVITDTLDRIAGNTEVEFVEEVARQITGRNILKITSLDNEEYYLPRLKEWAYFSNAVTIPSRETFPDLERVNVEMAEAFIPLVAERRAHPADDFVSRLIKGDGKGDALTDDEVVSSLILTLVAGHDTTLNTMALSIEALSRHPDAINFMRAHPDSMLNSILELSRYVAMSTHLGRIAADDFELGGKLIRKGQIVHLMLAGGNRDPKVFDDPERLDLERNQMQNLTFAPGIHHCIGHMFAKMQLEEFFTQFLERYESWEVLDEKLTFGLGVTFRGPIALNVRLHART